MSIEYSIEEYHFEMEDDYRKVVSIYKFTYGISKIDVTYYQNFSIVSKSSKSVLSDKIISITKFRNYLRIRLSILPFTNILYKSYYI